MARSVSGLGQDKGFIKLAVTHKNLEAFMGEYDPSKSLEEFIQDLCNHWELAVPTHYMLQFSTEPHHYVSDENKSKIKNGLLLNLVMSAPLLCSNVLAALTKPQQDKSYSINQLNKFASDPTFAKYFVDRQGLETVMGLVIELPQEDQLLSPLLQAFTELLNTARHTTSSVNWEMCDDAFVQKITMFVDTNLVIPEMLVLRSLIALENIVTYSNTKYIIVEKSINLLRLLEHLKTARDPLTRCAVLALVNALFSRAEPDRKEGYLSNLSDRKYRSYITDYVLSKLGGPEDHDRDQELCQQLHRLQQLLLNQLQPRMMKGVAPDDSTAAKKILDLRNVAFEADTEVSGGSSARREEIKKEYKKLGFKNDNPANDFNEVPPGVLALDNIHYFCEKRPDQYSKLVLENCYRADSHECPIGKASIDLTRLLASILKIGEAPREGCPYFHPMLFTNDHPVEELFCICIGLLNKTWKEMKATTEDFSKVMNVVEEQITLALEQQPANLDQFQKRLQQLTYKHIIDVRLKRRVTTEEQEMRAPQIQKLKEELKRDIREVVQQQRLRILEEGARFRNPLKKQKFFFCRLSPNHKLFHYDECDDKTTKVPALDDLTKKISVSDIMSIAIGKECPHNRRKLQYAFSLMLESGKTEAVSVDFVAPDEETYNIWHDGVKVLLKENMCSEAAERDIRLLLDMEIKLQLLDVEGVTIPPHLPPVPPLPDNYNFCFTL